MISNMYIYFFYLTTVALFFNLNDMLMFWVMMELNMVTFLSLILFTSNNSFKEEGLGASIYYFMVQSLGSLIFLLGISMKEMSFFSDFMFLFSVLLKMGLFPFYFWVYNIGENSISLITFLILTVQKIPFFFLLFTNFPEDLALLLLFSFLFGSLFLFFSSDFISMFISSSISSSFWVYFIFLDSMILFLTFFLFYTYLLFLFFNSFEPSTFSLTSYSEFLLLTSTFMFLVGLPPLSLFFFKFSLSFFLGSSAGIFSFLVFWLFSFLALIGYTNFFFSNFLIKCFLYLKNDFLILKMSFFWLQSAFFLYFVMWKSKLFKLLSSYLK